MLATDGVSMAPPFDTGETIPIFPDGCNGTIHDNAEENLQMIPPAQTAGDRSTTLGYATIVGATVFLKRCLPVKSR